VSRKAHHRCYRRFAQSRAQDLGLGALLAVQSLSIRSFALQHARCIRCQSDDRQRAGVRAAPGLFHVANTQLRRNRAIAVIVSSMDVSTGQLGYSVYWNRLIHQRLGTKNPEFGAQSGAGGRRSKYSWSPALPRARLQPTVLPIKHIKRTGHGFVNSANFTAHHTQKSRPNGDLIVYPAVAFTRNAESSLRLSVLRLSTRIPRRTIRYLGPLSGSRSCCWPNPGC
jgi:hypothetical protein